MSTWTEIDCVIQGFYCILAVLLPDYGTYIGNMYMIYALQHWSPNLHIADIASFKIVSNSTLVKAYFLFMLIGKENMFQEWF